MRPRRLLPALALIVGLVISLVWCVGPCCVALGAGSSSLSIGTIPCCRAETSSQCQPSIQRADGLAVAPSVAPMPLAILGLVGATPAVSADRPSIASNRATLPRRNLALLHAPLLI